MPRLTNNDREAIVNSLITHTFKKRKADLKINNLALAGACYHLITKEFEMKKAEKEIKAFGEKTSVITVQVDPEKASTGYESVYIKYGIKVNLYQNSLNRITLEFSEGLAVPRKYLYSNIEHDDPVLTISFKNAIENHRKKENRLRHDIDKLIKETTDILKGFTTHKALDEYSRLLSGFIPRKEKEKYLPIKPPEAFKALVACCKDDNCKGTE